jgi:hypothetical protein
MTRRRSSRVPTAGRFSLVVGGFVMLFILGAPSTPRGQCTSCSVWDASVTPATVTDSDPNAVELGLKFRTDVSGLVTGVRFYKGPSNTGTHVGHLWTSTGTLLGTVTFSGESGSGWQEAGLASPVPIDANTTYVVSYYAPNGHYSVDEGYFSSAGRDAGPLHALADGFDGGNGVYRYGTGGGFPTSTYASGNYWVDVVFSASAIDTTPPTVTAVSPTSGASGVNVTTGITAAFSEAMDSQTVSASSFRLLGPSSTVVSASVTYNSSTRSAVLTPLGPLAPSTTYTAVVKGGASDPRVKDVAGNALGTDVTWSFTTGTGTTPAYSWYPGDMHVHRSCGGSPEAISSLYSKMGTNGLAALSLLADMGNGEVLDPIQDLPRVNGADDPVSTSGRIVHWDAEWHWDAIYSQYPHQALGGHVVALGLSSAQQIWEEYTGAIFDWAHRQGGIAGFVHMQYLDDGIPSSLTCCTPVEYPVEVALGTVDFISEDVTGSDSAIHAYYRLLNTGFRPGLTAGTDYPCNGGAPLGSLLTYAQVPTGQMTYRNWIDGIAKGRTVVSRTGTNEFLDVKVNGGAAPGDEVRLTTGGSVPVTIQWTSKQSLAGTIELVQNGDVVASWGASASPSAPATVNGTVDFAKSGWLAARRMGPDGHVVHTGAVFVIVGGAPIRASAADAQFYVQWMDTLLARTSAGGEWSSYFTTSRTAAQTRYSNARAIFQQIAAEASGVSAGLSPSSVSFGTQQVGTTSLPQVVTLTNTGSTAVTVESISLGGTNASDYAQSNTCPATLAAGASCSIAVTFKPLASGTRTATLSVADTTVGSPHTVSLSGVGTAPAATLSAAAVSFGAQVVGTTSTQALTLSNTGSAPLVVSSIATSGDYAQSNNCPISPATLGASASCTINVAFSPTAVGARVGVLTVTDNATGSPRTASLTGTGMAAPTCPCSIWSTAAVPGTPDGGPDSAVELGVKFRSDYGGFITGLRFYKSPANTGTHVGNLWTNTGQLLATATFTGESSSGWQLVAFSSPVGITANTTYVASYRASAGHYSIDEGFFASNGIDNGPLHALGNGVVGENGVFAYGSTSPFPASGFNSSNYWVDVVFNTTTTDTTPPGVAVVSPANGASGVSLGATVIVTFSEPVDASTVTAGTVLLRDGSNNLVPASVAYTPGNSTAILTPTTQFSAQTTYQATVVGGASGTRVKDLAGNALPASVTWSFTTGGAPPNEGPGGPILVIAGTSNPFSRYYSEILRAEGLNEFTVTDISNVSAGVLSGYDVAILGNIGLSAAQVTMLSNWVNAGGNLIAMRPDKQLATLLGLTNTSATLADAYLLVNTSGGPGAGIVSQTVQYHGTADRYSLNGATSLATLYSAATTSTTAPAVTLRSVGAGQAAAFVYDLARSVVYTRQGNPAWSGQQRDGTPPARSDDLFYGAAAGDLQPDWVDLNKVSIPQADEQQRLLVNLILRMNSSKKPLPRLWYLPKGLKAAVIMTGDDHALGGTAGRFAAELARSPQGCVVDNWECVRSTSYVYPSTPISNAQASAYSAQGFELALHVTTGCADWTPTQLDSFYTGQLSSWSSAFSSVPSPVTNRTHCIAWSDYDTQPKVEAAHGIRLDTNYYFWPPAWVDDRPGFFTGSGMPMRFSTREGDRINVYQATTQMTDESGQSYPFTIDTLLDNAIGPLGYYGVFTANMHTDYATPDGWDAIVSSAQTRGIPVVSAAQMLRWLDGRNASAFGGISWSGNVLTFSLSVGTGASGLVAMLPVSGPTGDLAGITLGGAPVTYTTQTIKGIQYALFAGAAGDYRAAYGMAAPAVTLSPSSLSFGSQMLNTTSAALTVTLANTGTATMTISGSSLTGTNASNFTRTTTCGSTLAAGASCTFSVTFRPTALGSRTATLSISDNATGSPHQVALSGTGTGPVASLSPTSLSFGSQTINTTSAARTVTLTNTGTGTMTISSTSLTGTNASNFMRTTTCGSTLAAGARCTFSVTFKPTAVGSRTATLSISDNATGSPHTVALSGTGTGPVASLSPTSISFGSQAINTTSAARTVTLTNTGTATMTITSISITGTNASNFTRTTTCGSSLSFGASCTISVTFRPTVRAARAATLSVTDNASGSPHTVALSGTGI